MRLVFDDGTYIDTAQGEVLYEDMCDEHPRAVIYKCNVLSPAGFPLYPPDSEKAFLYLKTESTSNCSAAWRTHNSFTILESFDEADMFMQE